MSVECDLEIVNRLGLHARAAARFVQVAQRFDSEIRLVRDDRTVNGKSIMGVMMLAAGRGARLTLQAEGSDCEDALDALRTLVAEGFGENS